MEDLPTLISSVNRVGNVNSKTAAVIESIIGHHALHDVSKVHNAIGTLSSGEIGQTSAKLASQNIAQHAVVNTQNLESAGLQTSKNASIQLPDTKKLETSKLPEMFDLPDF